MTQDLRVDKRFIAPHYRGRDMLKIGWVDVVEESIAVQPWLFSSPLNRITWSTPPRILAPEDLSRKRPARVLGIDYNAQTRSYFKQGTSQFYTIIVPQAQVRQDKPPCQGRVLQFFFADFFNELDGTRRVPELGKQAQLRRLLHKIAYTAPLDWRVVYDDGWN